MEKTKEAETVSAGTPGLIDRKRADRERGPASSNRLIRRYLRFPFLVLPIWLCVIAITGQWSFTEATGLSGDGVDQIALSGQSSVTVRWESPLLRVMTDPFTGAVIRTGNGPEGPLPLQLTMPDGVMYASLTPESGARYSLRERDGREVYQVKCEDDEWRITDTSGAKVYRGKSTDEKFEIYDSQNNPLLKGKWKSGYVVRTPEGSVVGEASISLHGSSKRRFAALGALSAPLDIRFRLLLAALVLSRCAD